ncbi:hypothetical protein CC99x_012845 [Candidatus Berkiella cookevillensis]|uniref:Uncharacterized protein n=1 Tax=Candidatus Berkiella cookevillensis TaxID=437022 RepID=A0A0Q9Y9P3_9GAMM|nr:hypothetical protein [Candidatus Berkiella cookevillensis]MCS5709787.1 hypothetical protein [Candidatus Berkiella cookevillensis]
MPKSKTINSQKETKKFFNAIEKNPPSSLYTLCNLLLVANDSVQANHAINKIERLVSVVQLDKLIACMIKLENNKRLLLDKDRVESFKAFRIELMSQKTWLTRLTQENIIKLSTSDEFLFYGLIALTRSHLQEQALNDPFDKFDFTVLENAGIEQIRDVIEELVSSCSSLPLAAFKSIAKRDIEFARGILLFMQSHSLRFEMGEYCLVQHPALKDELYLNWKNTTESIPLTQQSETLLKSSVSATGSKHPEFLDILGTNRIKKDTPNIESQAQRQKYSFGVLSGITCVTAALRFAPRFTSLSSAAASYSGASLARVAIGSSAVAASAAVAPLIAPASLLLLGGFMVLKAKQRMDETRAIEKTTPTKYKSCLK